MDELIRTALAAAEAAVAVHRRDLGRTALHTASEKGRADYVSQTDLDAQAAALREIAARHPDHAILAEEDDRPVPEQIAAAGGGPLWIVDPLDGTANFLHGYPQYAASVAVAVEGRPVAGAVVSGVTGERWWAARGRGAFRDGSAIHVSSRLRLRDALVGTGFPFKRTDELPVYLGQLGRVLEASSGVRRGGAAALDLCYLAQGSLDAFWERILQPWDFAAGWVIVEEAGGVVTDLHGVPLRLAESGVAGAGSPELLAKLRDVLET